ncbi:hypothetical protein O3M35_007457 [Rhynocoris fuscipes]|uniref:Maturase K n=1 Tax=Rhynocoris fuscipes TaxID=488301 RepID=A0AAW1DGW3_9HEMI
MSYRLGVSYDDNYTALLSQLILTSLSTRRKHQDLMFLYDLLNSNIDSPYLLEQLHFHNSTFNSRSNYLFFIKFCHTNYLYNSPLNRMQRNANSLSKDVAFLYLSRHKFKKIIKKVLE